MKPKLIDTHAHVISDFYHDQLDFEIEEIIKKEMIVFNIGCNLIENEEVLSITKKFPNNFKAIIGIHPNEVLNKNSNLENLELMIKNNQNFIIAIGEIGLDYHYDINKEKQKEFFIKQIELALKYNLPIMLHSREAINDTLNILKQYKTNSLNFVFHSFTGTLEEAKEIIANNGYISFSGVITFKNAKMLENVIKYVPLDRIFVETDSPFLTPAPYRGKQNHPEYVYYVALKIAEIKNMNIEEILNNNFKNIQTFYKKI